VEQYKGNPRVQVHGPGFSKILFGDDKVDEWEKYLDLMVDSVLVNSGRGCINCSGIWVSRHGRKIAEALAERLGPIEPRPPDDPQAQLLLLPCLVRQKLYMPTSNAISPNLALRI
jgi:hypothetical protein